MVVVELDVERPVPLCRRRSTGSDLSEKRLDRYLVAVRPMEIAENPPSVSVRQHIEDLVEFFHYLFGRIAFIAHNKQLISTLL